MNYIKMNAKEKLTLWDSILRVIIPLIYLFFWYVIPISLFGKENVDVTILVYTALPVIFIGVISKQTTWSIGGEKGIKGDNIGRKARATIDRKGSFEFEGIDIDEDRVKTIIDAVKENPIYINKQKQDG